MVFTLGLLAVLKSPEGFDDQEAFVLAPDFATQSHPSEHRTTETVEQRLERAKQLRDEGVITNQEFEQRKSAILRDL